MSSVYVEDTIAAIATGGGQGSVSIIRVSGSDSIPIVDRIFHGQNPLSKVASHTVHYGYVREPQTSERVDEVLVLVMRGPRSYTSEDVVEIHCHGGPIVSQEVLRLLLGAGARLAEPGEFTKRAFLNGRIDLSQAEAVSQLIQAQSHEARKAAFRQVEGQLSRRIRSLRERLIELLAHIEVTIDYPEHDVEEVTVRHICDHGELTLSDMRSLLNGMKAGRLMTQGIRTAIVGKPNVGKSSLLNAILGFDRAIVTDVPGTTRDVVAEDVTMRGLRLHLSDTAGIRDTVDLVEKIGVERSREAVQDADLVLYVLDATTPLDEAEFSWLLDSVTGQVIVLINKTDIASPEALNRKVEERIPSTQIVAVSVKHADGMDALADAVERLFLGGLIREADTTYAGSERQIRLLEDACTRLRSGIDSADAGVTLDLVSVDYHEAWRLLGEIIGESAGEDLLDEIFSRFCLGK